MRQKHDHKAELPRYYLYKITVDDGGAPCVQDGTLSLAICKPQIRKTARTGDFILGFAANLLAPRYPDNCLVYVAKVTKPVEGKDYFSWGEYGSRRDSIYRWRDGRFSPTDNDFHRVEDLEHDLGRFPVYEKARVLISKGASNFRYFGNTNPID